MSIRHRVLAVVKGAREAGIEVHVLKWVKMVALL